MFNETPDGQTKYCIACELRPGQCPVGMCNGGFGCTHTRPEHTCGLQDSEQGAKIHKPNPFTQQKIKEFWNIKIDCAHSVQEEVEIQKSIQKMRPAIDVWLENNITQAHALGKQEERERIEKWAYNNGITHKESFKALLKFLSTPPAKN